MGMPNARSVNARALFLKIRYAATNEAPAKMPCPEGNELSGKWLMSGAMDEAVSGRGRAGSQKFNTQ